MGCISFQWQNFEETYQNHRWALTFLGVCLLEMHPNLHACFALCYKMSWVCPVRHLVWYICFWRIYIFAFVWAFHEYFSDTFINYREKKLNLIHTYTLSSCVYWPYRYMHMCTTCPILIVMSQFSVYHCLFKLLNRPPENFSYLYIFRTKFNLSIYLHVHNVIYCQWLL